MAKFTSSRPVLSPRMALEGKYNAARMNLLLVIAFTVINLVLLFAAGGNFYFLFSAFVPYYAGIIGMLYCGKFPAEFYEDYVGFEFLDNSFLFVMIILAVAFTLPYLIAWLCSKNHKVGWLIFALVWFGLDTVLMIFLNGIALDSLFDILFHAWVIYYLVMGIVSHNKLKKLPPDEPAPVDPMAVFETDATEIEAKTEEATEENTEI